MAGRLAIDFGTSNSRAALWDEIANQAKPLTIPDVSMVAQYKDSGGMVIDAPYVPSLIHYDGDHVWIGKQVHARGLLEAKETFRWMKRYISNRLELPRQIKGKRITFPQAGTDFLARLIDYASTSIGLGDEEVAFTAAVEAFEHYQDWLSNDVYMVFDFGGGTLDVSIVLIEAKASSSKRCRCLGKAGNDIGGTVIDQWLYQDVLRRCEKQPEDVRRISTLLLLEIDQAKQRLTTEDRADVIVSDPQTSAVINASYTRTTFEDLLEGQGLFTSIQRTVNYALKEAGERGYKEEHIKAVLLVGGSSLIPCVRRTMRQMFGERVKYHRPLDAVALGGAAFVGGVDFYDHIQHDYALRYYNRKKGDYDYTIIVPAGTPYPTQKPIREITVKAAYEDQEFLGLDIYEVNSKQRIGSGEGALIDLVYDSSGLPRFQQRHDVEVTGHFWVNGKCPAFIHAQPKAKEGEKRFPVRFTIDGNKRLCVTVFDNQTGKHLMRDHPLIKLT